MKKLIPLVIIILALVVGAIIYTNQDKPTNEDLASSNSAMSDKNMMVSEEKGQQMDKMGSETQSKPGEYSDYSETKVKDAQASGQKVVLFFHANWCPFCRAADEAFKANLGKLPTGVTLLKVDYDSNTSLKQKYGVTYQHTFVQIDNSGNKITSWVSGDVDLLNKNIK
jgi:thiol-disulfide isomerase/thioredoxin